MQPRQPTRAQPLLPLRSLPGPLRLIQPRLNAPQPPRQLSRRHSLRRALLLCILLRGGDEAGQPNGPLLKAPHCRHSLLEARIKGLDREACSRHALQLGL